MFIEIYSLSITLTLALIKWLKLYRNLKLKINKLCIVFLLITFNSDANNIPQFSDFLVPVSSGPFVKNLSFKSEPVHSEEWEKMVGAEILKPVNYDSHFRLVLIKNGELPLDCGEKGWVCGWVIDKLSGEVVSELPEFNGNTKYFSTIDNGTPSPDLFDIGFYPNSSMLWLAGQNTPVNNKNDEAKCANTAYKFKNDKFTKLISARCEVDVGSDTSADPYLPSE